MSAILGHRGLLLKGADSGGGSPQGVELLLHFDGSFVDSSTRARVPTATNEMVINTDQKKFGSASAELKSTDGSGGLFYNVDANLHPQGGDFNWEGWFFFRSYSDMVLFDLQGAARLSMQNDGTGYMTFSIDSGSSPSLIINPPFYWINAWHHVALTKKGSTARVFFNGNKIAELNVPGNLVPSSRFALGSSAGGSFLRLNGFMDEVRIIKGLCLYEDSFTPPAAPFPDS